MRTMIAAFRKWLTRASLRKAVAVSMIVHFGALILFASSWVEQRLERVLFAGADRVVQVDLTLVQPPPEPPVLEVSAEQEPVVIRPTSAQIAKRTFVDSLAADHPAAFQLEPLPMELALETEAQQPLPSSVSPKSVAAETPPASSSIQPPAIAKAQSAIRPENPTPIAPPQTLGTDNETPPSFDGNRPPRYPELARLRGWEGTVLLRLMIAADGRVTNVEVAESSGYPILDAEAVTTVRTWKGRPATRGGKPVATEELLPVRFVMR
jgi:protein TonB